MTLTLKNLWGKKSESPPVWLIALIAGLPIFSETMYTPSLPSIARALSVSHAWVEYTLSIYFLGTALGTLFWGRLSDKYGRKPCLIAGFTLYIASCLICYGATHIYWLWGARLLQSLGVAVGVVLGQTISHDAFEGKRHAQAFSTIGSILALAPALGAALGGMIDQLLNWRLVFLLLMIWGAFIVIFVFIYLPETLPKDKRSQPALLPLLKKMMMNRSVVSCSLIVGIANGILYSYNAEGPFFMMSILGLTPVVYGFGFTAFALTGSLGSYLSRLLHNTQTTTTILQKGLIMIFLGTVIFAAGASLNFLCHGSPKAWIFLTFGCMLIICFGRGLTIANCLALGLKDFRTHAGSATSLFVCSYYAMVAAITTIMGMLHNDTLIPMPFYFLLLGFLLFSVQFLLKKTS